MQRPISAPLARTRPLEQSGEPLLKLEDLLKDDHLSHVGEWWQTLPIVGRARGRWVFAEPPGLSFPRQRARRELFDQTLDDLDLPEDSNIERHNKSQHFKPVKGTALMHWKSFCLQSTNQAFQKVPEPDHYFGAGVWMRMFRKSHGGLLRSGALQLVEKWQPHSSQRQRAALSELLWSFNDYLTARRGRTETKTQYGPKQGEKASITLIDPFSSSLGRPSSAPIAHAVQRKFERQQKEAEAAMLARGREMRKHRLERPKSAKPYEKREVDTLKSSVPLKMAGAGEIALESSNQVQMRTVKPKDLAMAIKWGVPTIASKPPATSGMGRHLGHASWHGDVMYPKFWPPATKTFQPLHEMRRPWDIPGHDRLKKLLI